MAEQMQNKAENKGFYKEGFFLEFVRWSALPPIEKMREGIMTQGDFAKVHGINKDTLTRWKQRPDFEARVDKLRHQWGRQKMPDILYSIYRSAIQGNAKSQKLFLDYTNPKSGKGEVLPIVQPGDIRYLIDQLPKDLQDKYNLFLRDLAADVKAMDEGRFDDMSNSPNYHGL